MEDEGGFQEAVFLSHAVQSTKALYTDARARVVGAGGFPFLLNEFTVADIPIRAAADGKPEAARIKVKLRLDINGCLQCESAQAIEELEVVEETPAAPTPPSEGGAGYSA